MTARQRKYRLYSVLIALEGLFFFWALFLGIILYANWGAAKNEVVFAFKEYGWIKTASPTPSPSTSLTPTPAPTIEPAHIIISKIGIDVPLQWDIPAEETTKFLNKGVAHLKGSAKLGQEGNLFITGHSSDYAWKKNPYAAVFSLVPKLVAGDKITIRENGKEYVYQVAETKIVDPDHVEVASPTTTPILTLLTCYPVGTTKDRFVVHASLISSPEKPVKVDPTKAYTLPELKFR